MEGIDDVDDTRGRLPLRGKFPVLGGFGAPDLVYGNTVNISITINYNTLVKFHKPSTENLV